MSQSGHRWLSTFYAYHRKPENEIVDDAFDCAILINSRWIQTITRLLKSNGFADSLNNPSNVNKETFAKQFLQRCKTSTYRV